MHTHTWQRIAGWLPCALTLAGYPAYATEFRRPFDEAISLGYGYDHDGGGAGCTAYDCGGRCYDGHRGNDYPLPYGTNVRAAAAGTVTYVSQGCPDVGFYCSQCGGGFGNYVRVRHADGRDTYYGHLEHGSVVVSNGQSVSCGQKLAQSASSGCSTGYHLHFDLRSGSSRLDPYAGGCAAGPSDWVGQGSGMPSAECENVCACTPGNTQSGACGNCGTRARTCGGDCQWGGWSACTGEGECAPGADQAQACGDCGSQTRHCDENCRWGGFDACDGPDPDGGERVCDAGGLGPCGDGRVRCREGNHACEALFSPTDERCDDVDNDCDGEIDDGQPQQLGDPQPPWAAELIDASWPRALERGEVGEVWADFRNVGHATWPAGQVWLQAASSERSELSPLQHLDSWQAWDVPAVVWRDTAPGEVVRVAFQITLGEASAAAADTFGLRNPDGDWLRCPRPGFEIAVANTSVDAVEPPVEPPSPERVPPLHIDATGAVGCGCALTSAGPSAWLLVAFPLAVRRRRRRDG